MGALLDYKKENIKVAYGLVVLNVSQSIIITAGMVISLIVANYLVYETNDMTVGDFIAINTYII